MYLRQNIRLILLRSLFALLIVFPLSVSADDAIQSDRIDLSDGLILVAGASGRTGHYVIKHLNEEGLTFRSMTRDRDEAILRWGQSYVDMNWAEGDARDPAQMREIMRGVRRVVCIIGSKNIDGPNGPEFVDYGGVRNLVDAAVEEGVEHFVLMTSMGVTDRRHPLNKRLGDVMKWRYKGEKHLRKSGLNYTIMRPVNLVDGHANQLGLQFYQGDDWEEHIRGTVSRDDLSFVMIEALRNPDAREKTFEVKNDASVPLGVWREFFATLKSD
jgi:uncharacterized protein YbjT (DUF2867 family)